MTKILKHNKNNDSLVSIIIITYNSSKYVLETLESAKAQTYQNIELIVSDDCSKDNTVKICKIWLKKNRNRFANTEIIESDVNSGISANCNRGMRVARGEWVKLIAGDDILTQECISFFLRYANDHPEADFIYGAVAPFSDDTIFKAVLPPKYFRSASANKQHRLLLKNKCYILGPSSFMRREILHALGNFDERNPMQEDYPLWLKLTGLNYRLYFTEFICAKYRRHTENITGISSSNIELALNFSKAVSKTNKFVRLPLLLKNRLYLHYWNCKLGIWRSNMHGLGLCKILRWASYIIDPLGIYIKILRFLGFNYGYKKKFAITSYNTSFDFGVRKPQ